MTLGLMAAEMVAGTVWSLVSTLSIRDALGHQLAVLPVISGRAQGYASGSGVASKYQVNAADGSIVYGPAPILELGLSQTVITTGAQITIRVMVQAA